MARGEGNRCCASGQGSGRSACPLAGVRGHVRSPADLAGLDGHRTGRGLLRLRRRAGHRSAGGPGATGRPPALGPQADGVPRHDPEPAPGASAPGSVQPTGAPGSQVSGSGPASPGTVGAAETSAGGVPAPAGSPAASGAAPRGGAGGPTSAGAASTGTTAGSSTRPSTTAGSSTTSTSSTTAPATVPPTPTVPVTPTVPADADGPAGADRAAHPDRAGATRRPGGRAHAGLLGPGRRNGRRHLGALAVTAHAPLASAVRPTAGMAGTASEIGPDVGSSAWLTEVAAWPLSVLLLCPTWTLRAGRRRHAPGEGARRPAGPLTRLRRRLGAAAHLGGMRGRRGIDAVLRLRTGPGHRPRGGCRATG